MWKRDKRKCVGGKEKINKQINVKSHMIDRSFVLIK